MLRRLPIASTAALSTLDARALSASFVPALACSCTHTKSPAATLGPRPTACARTRLWSRARRGGAGRGGAHVAQAHGGEKRRVCRDRRGGGRVDAQQPESEESAGREGYQAHDRTSHTCLRSKLCRGVCSGGALGGRSGPRECTIPWAAGSIKGMRTFNRVTSLIQCNDAEAHGVEGRRACLDDRAGVHAIGNKHEKERRERRSDGAARSLRHRQRLGRRLATRRLAGAGADEEAQQPRAHEKRAAEHALSPLPAQPARRCRPTPRCAVPCAYHHLRAAACSRPMRPISARWRTGVRTRRRASQAAPACGAQAARHLCWRPQHRAPPRRLAARVQSHPGVSCRARRSR